MSELAANVEVVRQQAHELDVAIKGRVRNIWREWVLLAGELHEFRNINGWTLLGYETQEAYLADAELGIRRTQIYRLMQAYQELVIDRGVTPEQLARIDSSKVWEVLPAIRRGRVDTERALADAQVLGQTDLRERYRSVGGTDPIDPPPGRGGFEPDKFHYEACPHCGQRMRIEDE